MKEMFVCPICGNKVNKEYTEFTYDICGIPFRKLCKSCANEIMNNKGFDGRDYRNDCCEAIWD